MAKQSHWRQSEAIARRPLSHGHCSSHHFNGLEGGKGGKLAAFPRGNFTAFPRGKACRLSREQACPLLPQTLASLSSPPPPLFPPYAPHPQRDPWRQRSRVSALARSCRPCRGGCDQQRRHATVAEGERPHPLRPEPIQYLPPPRQAPSQDTGVRGVVEAAAGGRRAHGTGPEMGGGRGGGWGEGGAAPAATVPGARTLRTHSRHNRRKKKKKSLPSAVRPTPNTLWHTIACRTEVDGGHHHRPRRAAGGGRASGGGGRARRHGGATTYFWGPVGGGRPRRVSKVQSNQGRLERGV